MNEDIVADFTARFILNHGSGETPTPVEGRIIGTKKRLVLATADDKQTIPLSRVIDVNVGNAPRHVATFFADTVTVGYETDDGVQSVVIESAGETVETFVGILFRCLLNGRTVATKHPARVGGRVKETAVSIGSLRIKDRHVALATDDGGFGIDVATVMNIDRANKLGSRDDRVTLVIKHTDPDSRLTKTTLIAPAKSQYVNLLARYLRLTYDDICAEVEAIELSNPEKKVLVGIHTTGGDIDFKNVLDGDAAYVTNVLNSVRNKELIVESSGGISLTPQGRIVVSKQIEDVNA